MQSSKLEKQVRRTILKGDFLNSLNIYSLQPYYLNTLKQNSYIGQTHEILSILLFEKLHIYDLLIIQTS